MQWRGRRESGNVVDRRGMKVGGTLGAGGLIIALIYMFFGGDPSAILNSNQDQPQTQNIARDDSEKSFVSVVLADTEDVWRHEFANIGQKYQDPKLVLFNGQVESACGLASSAVGPFYCPADQLVYLDLSFFNDLSEKLGAKGDLARAYVIAHEVGHHVQNLLGISERSEIMKHQLNAEEANQISVKIELQADCFAGVWAKKTDQQKQILEGGDLQEALTAAAAVGDDRLQMASKGHVVPDSFTHGSSEQRSTWFSRGFAEGKMEDCDTFQNQLRAIR